MLGEAAVVKMVDMVLSLKPAESPICTRYYLMFTTIYEIGFRKI